MFGLLQIRRKPRIVPWPVVSSSSYICSNCGGIGFYVQSMVIHRSDCPHFPSEGNLGYDEVMKMLEDRFCKKVMHQIMVENRVP